MLTKAGPKRQLYIYLVCFPIVFTYLLAVVPLEAGVRPDNSQDDAPSFFQVYSASGNEKFQAECTWKAAEIVNCLFVGTRINAASASNRTPSAFENLSTGDKKKAKEEFLRMSLSKDDREMIQKLEERLLRQSIGQKTREWLRSWIEAYKARDFEKFARLIDEKEKRTCEAFVQVFRLDFKKIGPGKWLANPGPNGLCQIVKIYELRRSETHDLWEMIETRVTAGSTEGSCKGVEQELQKPTVWSWRNPTEFELSCDYMKYSTWVLID